MAEAETKIAPKESLDEVIHDLEGEAIWHSEGRIVCVAENVIAGDEQQDQVKDAFPSGIFFDHKCSKDLKCISIGGLVG